MHRVQIFITELFTMLTDLYVIYTNHEGGLYQIYKPEAKPSVYTSDINRTMRFVYCF